VLFVGGDFERKGGPSLLQALPDGCDLDIVTKAEIQPRPNVRVHHGLGPNSPGLLRLFEQADVFALPSLGECLAVVLMEATAAGLPVITTGVGALPEAVRPGESGIVISAGEVAPLRDALQNLAGDAPRRRQMGRAGRLLARQKFDSVLNNLSILDFIAELVEAQPALQRVA
jgi:glycosyltransferase involved in cell wall biosynthesis